MDRPLGALTYPEITDQAHAHTAALAQLQEQEAWVSRYLGATYFDQAIFIGSGSSYYQAQIMALTFRLWTGREATALPSSEIFLFRDRHASADRSYLLVGVSRSGESTEVLLALESVRTLPNWSICGITCCADSAMAKAAPCVVSPRGREQSTVMTKSFSSMTLLMQAAIARAAGRQDMACELTQAVAMVPDAIAGADAFMQAFATEQAFANYMYLGMGAYAGLSQEAALKLKEMAGVWTESFGTLEFRHGPKAVVAPGTLVCLLLSEQARPYELKVAEEMKAYGAKILIFTAAAGPDTEFADFVLTVGGRALSDEARTILYLPAVQLLGFYTAVSRGLDPDEPRNLTQVVRL